jgi:hypothetical protein
MDAGHQPLQHLLDQVDRQLDAGQLGGQARDRLARLGPGYVQPGPEPAPQGAGQRNQAEHHGGRDHRRTAALTTIAGQEGPAWPARPRQPVRLTWRSTW